MSLLPDRLPPQSIDAEQAALGAALLSRTACELLLEKLDTGDFYLEAHRKIFDAIAYLFLRAGEIPDTLTVPEELKKRGQLEAVGGIGYVLTLAESVPTAGHAEYYIRLVAEPATRRRVISDAQQILSAAYDPECPLDELETLIQQRADTPLQRDLSEIVPAAQWMQATGDDYGERAEGKPQHYFRTGFTRLDSFVEFAGGDLIIVAARPSVGKTALALEMMVGGALLGQPVGFISLEMKKQKVGIRMLCSYTGRWDLAQGVSLITLRDHAKPDSPDRLTPEEAQRIAQAEAQLGALPMFIVDQSSLTMPQLAAHAKQLVRRHGIKALFVDYLQKIDYGQAESMRIGTTLVTRALKTLARNLNIPVIALSQLTRRLEQRGKSERRPLLSDLKESGAIEEEADGVILLHRDDYFQRSEHPGMDDGEGGMEAITAKSRNGATGITRLETSLRCGRIFEAGTYRDDAPPEHWDERPARAIAEPEEVWWK